MTFTFTASFEYDLRPAQTLRGTVQAGAAAPAARRAIEQARQALRPIRPRSCVVVLEYAREGDDEIESEAL